jgi:hypothetical protein
MSSTTAKYLRALPVRRDSFEFLARSTAVCMAARIDIFRTDLPKPKVPILKVAIKNTTDIKTINLGFLSVESKLR